jgi:hypothetical protein
MAPRARRAAKPRVRSWPQGPVALHEEEEAPVALEERLLAPRLPGAGGGVARLAAALADPRLAPAQRAGLMHQLQQRHGNAQVARMVARAQAQAPAPVARLLQRDCPPAAVERPPVAPEEDARFQATTAKIGQVAAKEKQHPPAKAKAAEAQAAAAGPANEVASQAKAGQVEKMGQQQPGVFDKKAFVAAVRKAVAAAAPKSLTEAVDYKESGKAAQVKGQVAGLVKSGKEGAEQGIKQATTATPDAGKAKPKPVTPMKPESPGPPPGPVGAPEAMPKPKPADEIDLRHDQCATNSELQEAGVTEEQLRKSNEPQFQEAVDAKKEAEAHSTSAPAEFRAEEQDVLGQARTQAGAAAARGTGAMHAGRAGALAQVMAGKAGAKAADEAKRAKVAGELEAIYARTKQDVTTILNGIDGKINPVFDAGEKAARQAMETHIETRTRAFKKQRYSGIRGKLRWLKDKFSAPPELNQFVDEGVKVFTARMDAVIDQVADIVGAELTKAKARIVQGRQEVQRYVAGLPKDLQQIGKAAAADIAGRFEELDQQVTDKQQALVDDLAQKYVEARDRANERANAMKEANKGLWDRAKDLVKGVIETIKKLKDMLLNVLAKAADVIGTIIRDPIGFLGNLVSAVKMGLNQFVSNIGAHLKKGLMGWLFGTLAEAGIRMPESFDLKGILSLVLQLLGLTYENIRARAVKVVGEKALSALEKTADVFVTLVKEGPAGLWKFISDKLASLKDAVMDQIKDFVITKVITAGITWLLSLLNPASAFIKACKMIYDVVMFFIERGSQIMSLVNAILDSIGAIASGALASAANMVEQALAKAIPVAISFLASLLGLGGIADKIKSVIQAIQAPVNKLIDTVIGGALKLFKKLGGDKIIAAAQKGIAWTKDKIQKGKEWVKKKASAAGAWAKAKAKGLFGKKVAFTGGGERHALWIDVAGGQPRLMVASNVAELEKMLGRLTTDADEPAKLPAEKKAEALGLIGEARALKDGALKDASESEPSPELQRLAAVMGKLFNLFVGPRSAEQGFVATLSPAELDQVIAILVGLETAIRAAQLSKDARAYVEAARAAAGLTPDEARLVGMFEGDFGIALGEYVDEGGKTQGVAAINAVGFGASKKNRIELSEAEKEAIIRRGRELDARRKGGEKLSQEERDFIKMAKRVEEGTQTSRPMAAGDQEVLAAAVGKIYDRLEQSLAGKYTVLRGAVSKTGQPASSEHAEVMIRNYLKEQGAAVHGRVIPIGVSQNTVCGRCVNHLLKGTDVAGSAESGGAKQPGVTAGGDPEKQRRVMVLGNKLAGIIAGG